jgi:RHS repeat-associated protein
MQTFASGNQEETCKSYPFGDGLACTGGTDAAEHHFTGKERDAESGNDYFGARYYSSAMGRFMSPDWSAKEEPVPYAQLDDPQSLNLYAYVRNNPLTRVDADGHCPVCLAYLGEIAGGAAIGAVIRGGVEVVASLATHQDVTWANVKGAMAQGAITGSIAAATEGTSLVFQGAAQAGANIVGGLIGRKISGSKTTATDVIVDGVSGATSPKLGKMMGAKLTKMVGNKTVAEAESKLGSKLGSRHAASVAGQVAAAQSSEETAGAVANAAGAVAAQSVEKKADQH